MNVSELNTAEARLRTISAVVLAPAFLFIVYLGGPAYTALIILMMATGLYEWLRLVDPAAPLADRIGLYAALVASLLLAGIGLPTFSVVTILMAMAVFYAHRSTVEPKQAFWFAMGLPYIAGSGTALIYLRNTPEIGLANTAYLLAIVWGMDIGAYVVGRLLGGPKLAPSISPNKTRSGFIGGLILAVLASSFVLLITHAQVIWVGLIIAALLAALAQAGDLFKSFFKRRAGVKDCGNLIPGHGGVLDRFDGLIFAALALAFLQVLFGEAMIW